VASVQTGAERLRASGLRATRPRLAVLEVLQDARSAQEHLPVAEVVARARRRLGTLSTQAAYDCLEALAEAGLARRIEPAGHPSRYEARVGDNHHHLVCRACGHTVDVDCAVGPTPCLTPSTTAGFVIDEAEVVFWGTCPTCAASAAVPAPRAARPTPREEVR
jgi:Fur family transcriptional regulator, stress-responsive regulator